MASSNRERSQSNMPKQHKRSQRTHQMREKPQPACRNSELEILVVFICIYYCYRHQTKKRKKYGDDLHPNICKVYVPNNLVQSMRNCWLLQKKKMSWYADIGNHRWGMVVFKRGRRKRQLYWQENFLLDKGTWSFQKILWY